MVGCSHIRTVLGDAVAHVVLLSVCLYHVLKKVKYGMVVYWLWHYVCQKISLCLPSGDGGSPCRCILWASCSHIPLPPAVWAKSFGVLLWFGSPVLHWPCMTDLVAYYNSWQRLWQRRQQRVISSRSVGPRDLLQRAVGLQHQQCRLLMLKA